MHSLHGGALSSGVAGLLGARLGGLIGLDLPVAPGFVVGTAAWHLSRLLGAGCELPPIVAQEVRQALGELDGHPPLAVRAAPAMPGAAACPPVLDVDLPEQLEVALWSLIEPARIPTAVIVQARTDADGKPPSGHGHAFTRDPQHGTVWPVGEFRSGRTVMSLDDFSRCRPAAGVQLRAALSRVESLQRGVSEVRFTLAAGRLWIDDAKPARHSRAAAESVARAGLGEARLRPARAAGPGS